MVNWFEHLKIRHQYVLVRFANILSRHCSPASLLAIEELLHKTFLIPDHPGVDHLEAVSDHLLDQALLHQVNKRLLLRARLAREPRTFSTHLQPLGDDEFVSGDLLAQLVLGGFVKQNQVVHHIGSLGYVHLLGLTLLVGEGVGAGGNIY